MSQRITSLIAYLLLLTPVIASSHPGHGQGGGDLGLMHYLTEPWHAPLMLLLLGVLSVVVANRFLSRRRLQRSTRPGR